MKRLEERRATTQSGSTADISIARRPKADYLSSAIKEGDDGCSQLVSLFGHQLKNVVAEVIGAVQDGELHVQQALESIYQTALKACSGCDDRGSEDAVVAVEMSCDLRCSKCLEKTVVAGFAGRGICWMCFLKGDEGLSNIEMNYILGGGFLTGEGALTAELSHVSVT